MRARGWELAINWNDRAGDYHYSIGAQMSGVRNKAIKFTGDGPIWDGSGMSESIIKNEDGGLISRFFGYTTDGLFQTWEEVYNHSDEHGNLIQPDAQPGDIKFIDRNHDGKLTDEDKVYIGNPYPALQLGLNMNFEYKGFDLAANFFGTFGNKIFNLQKARYSGAGDTERLRWTIIKTGCTEIAGEDQFNKFIENNTTKDSYQGGVTNSEFQDCKKLFGWTDDYMTTRYLIKPSHHKSARIIRKYFVPLSQRPEVYNICKIPLNHRILRFADVLLMYAEACQATGDEGNAHTALNRVRTRVNLPDVTSGGNALRDAIRLERRLELAFEQCRLYDIRRWKGDSGKSVMAELFGPDGSFVKYNTGANADMYEKNNQGEPSDKGTRFSESRDLLWPIPQYEIQHSNGAIEQNPGF